MSLHLLCSHLISLATGGIREAGAFLPPLEQLPPPLMDKNSRRGGRFDEPIYALEQIYLRLKCVLDMCSYERLKPKPAPADSCCEK